MKEVVIPAGAGALDATVNYWLTRMRREPDPELVGFGASEYNLSTEGAAAALESLLWSRAPSREIGTAAYEFSGFALGLRIAHIVQRDPYEDPREAIAALLVETRLRIDDSIASGDYESEAAECRTP